MGIKAVMFFVLQSLCRDKFFFPILLSLTFMARFAGRQLNSFFGPYCPEWLPGYVNIISIHNAPFDNPGGLSWSLVLLHSLWVVVLVAAVFWGEACAKNNIASAMGWKDILKFLIMSILMFIVSVWVAIKFNGESRYFGSFFYEHDFFYVLVIILIWWWVGLVVILIRHIVIECFWRLLR